MVSNSTVTAIFWNQLPINRKRKWNPYFSVKELKLQVRVRVSVQPLHVIHLFTSSNGIKILNVGMMLSCVWSCNVKPESVLFPIFPTQHNFLQVFYNSVTTRGVTDHWQKTRKNKCKICTECQIWAEIKRKSWFFHTRKFWKTRKSAEMRNSHSPEQRSYFWSKYFAKPFSVFSER